MEFFTDGGGPPSIKFINLINKKTSPNSFKCDDHWATCHQLPGVLLHDGGGTTRPCPQRSKLRS